MNDKAIIPLQNQIRERLFQEWVSLLDIYRRHEITKSAYGADDPELKAAVAKRILTLRLDLMNYEEIKIDAKDGYQQEIEAIGRILFRLGIIDATVEKKIRVVVSDW
jgi:hypothetical protein